jgi:hypothetical protein
MLLLREIKRLKTQAVTKRETMTTPSPEHIQGANDQFRRKHGHAPQTDAECREAYQLAQAQALIDFYADPLLDAATAKGDSS